MTSSHQDMIPCQCFPDLARALDRRSVARLVWLFLGAVLARGRKTVTSWIRTAALSTQFRPCYTTVADAGKKAKEIAARLAGDVVKPLLTDQARLTLALDDTPTRRHGPFVQGAGIHHNPTPGPAGSQHVYGHICVVLGCWRSIRPGESSRCRFGHGCMSVPRIYPASFPSTVPSSGPSWKWPSSC
jgi:hypothetical protein